MTDQREYAQGPNKHYFLYVPMYCENDQGPNMNLMKGWQAGFGPQTTIWEPLKYA